MASFSWADIAEITRDIFKIRTCLTVERFWRELLGTERSLSDGSVYTESQDISSATFPSSKTGPLRQNVDSACQDGNIQARLLRFLMKSLLIILARL